MSSTLHLPAPPGNHRSDGIASNPPAGSVDTQHPRSKVWPWLGLAWYVVVMGSRVLLVDDSLAVGRQLERILAGDDRYQVVGHARNGAEAVKLFASESPDLIVMDIVMPVMDGLQALRTILGMEKGARVVMISSVGGVGEKAAEALRMGARAVVSKPFEPEEVLSTFERILAEES